jgi:hypothetical protein
MENGRWKIGEDWGIGIEEAGAAGAVVIHHI